MKRVTPFAEVAKAAAVPNSTGGKAFTVGVVMPGAYPISIACSHPYMWDFLSGVAGVCAERGLARLEWAVLDWNEPSIGFYRSLGAVTMDEWTVFRLDGAALESLGRDG